MHKSEFYKKDMFFHSKIIMYTFLKQSFVIQLYTLKYLMELTQWQKINVPDIFVQCILYKIVLIFHNIFK